ncbi:MAG: AAA family ATPase [Thiogranum sp.]|jgi:type II secretory pathway predicted ATPase ExeA|nr:AAA family ATPase [Thiogranum sp.]
MYEQFYGFSSAPFAHQPAAGGYDFCEHQRQILDSLETRFRQGRCVCLLQGVAGVGKSTLVEALTEALGDSVAVSVVDAAQATAGVPLAARWLNDAGVACTADTEAAIIKYLAAYRRTLSEAGRRALLVVDNADRLTAGDCRMLDALVEGDAEPSVQLLLVTAQSDRVPGSEEPACAALAQRIVEHYTLLPLSPMETDDYIRQRLVQADGSPELFTPTASAAVFRYSQGLPRLVNRVCDLALVYGFSRQSALIDERTMEFVLNDRWGGSQKRESISEFSARSLPQAPADSSPVALRQPAQLSETSQGNAQLARQLVELLKKGGTGSEPAPRPVSERDMYDFIRLSLRYHQRHVERFVLGIVVGVALLAAGGLWTLITWQNDQLMPSAAASSTPVDTGGRDAGLAPVQAGADYAAVRPPVAANTAVIPSPAQAASVASPDPVPPATPPVQPQPAVQATATAALPAAEPPTPAPSLVKAQNRALEREQQKLERERQRLKKQIASERAERERLKEQSERERERVRKAQLLIEDARKSTRTAWDRINTDTPEAFPEQ